MKAEGAWWVTGAASGIGKVLTGMLKERGERLVLWDRDAAGLKEAAAALGSAVVSQAVVDVADPVAVSEAAAAMREQGVGVANLVHCAGILRAGNALDMDPEVYRSMMEVNLLGSVHMARSGVPLLQAARERGGRVTLTLVGSVAGLRGFPGIAGYSASKFAVVGFAQALRDELSDTGVEVRVLCPPPVDTPMVRSLPEVPPVFTMAPAIKPQKVARALLQAVDGNGPHVILVDARSKVLWSVARLLPGTVDELVRRAMRSG